LQMSSSLGVVTPPEFKKSVGLIGSVISSRSLWANNPIGHQNVTVKRH
jgi:hypothetical protein